MCQGLLTQQMSSQFSLHTSSFTRGQCHLRSVPLLMTKPNKHCQSTRVWLTAVQKLKHHATASPGNSGIPLGSKTGWGAMVWDLLPYPPTSPGGPDEAMLEPLEKPGGWCGLSPWLPVSLPSRPLHRFFSFSLSDSIWVLCPANSEAGRACALFPPFSPN